VVRHRAPLQALLDVLAGRRITPAQLDAAGWGDFLAEASRHGVSALVAHALRRDAERLPAHVGQALEQQLLRNRMRNMRLFTRLSDTLAALTAAGIEVIVLKGAHLARAVYEDPGLRAMSDADLLVREADLDRVRETLAGLGWHVAPPLPEGGHQLPTFEHDGVQIDVHWSIEDSEAPFAIDVAGLWQRAEPSAFGQARARVLAPEDLLLHLCMHTAYGHGWRQFDGGLRQLTDIAVVLRRYASSLDWERFGARARAWRVERCVWLALAVAHELLAAPIPDGVSARLVAPSPALARWTDDATALALGAHFEELPCRLPALSRTSTNKRWRRLPSWDRWREVLWPPLSALPRTYPALVSRPIATRVACWRDLATDLAQALGRPGHRGIWSRERRRHAMLRWMEHLAG
jgi:hypothetical protein